MQITHEEARRLIQFNADEVLKGHEKSLLEGHLNSCQECRNYAVEIKRLELILIPMMQRKWNQNPLPIRKQAAVPRSHPGFTEGFNAATRMIAMGILCIAVLFNIWQFSKSSGQDPNLSSANVPPIPTPSVFSTTTKLVGQECEQIHYTVKANERLSNIADQFSVPEQEIKRINNMDQDTLYPSMSLLIPICAPTTPGTTNTAITTFTPLQGSTTTPVNWPTQ